MQRVMFSCKKSLNNRFNFYNFKGCNVAALFYFYETMFRFYLTIALFISSPFFSFCQDYWQQEVNYTINVELDDQSHELLGDISFEYINHSPDTLKELYIHLWPNAYSNGKTALAGQLSDDWRNKLNNESSRDRGYIDSLSFHFDGQAISHTFYNGHIDIALIKLLNPLLPETSIIVSTPFRVQIPSGLISRLGHIGQSYQITQWYPKPAVYDKNGWNPIPYLNQGEFYSEFGSFDVSITLPDNYVVCLLYTSPSPRDQRGSRMPSSA